MADWKFRDKENLESFLISELGENLRLPKVEQNVVEYFSNGDKMTINLETGQMDWKPIHPDKMATSRLSVKLHMWYGKGIIAVDKTKE